MNIPKDLKYTKSHEWIRVEGEFGYVGLSDFAQSELGDIVFLDINTVGETLNKEEAFGTVEAVKTVSDIFMPVSGEVIEKNESLDGTPDTVNKDPYGNGWLIKIKITNAAELNDLMDAATYEGQLH